MNKINLPIECERLLAVIALNIIVFIRVYPMKSARNFFFSFFCHVLFLTSCLHISVSSAATYTVKAGAFQPLDVGDTWTTSIPAKNFAKYESAGPNMVGFTGSVDSTGLCSGTVNKWSTDTYSIYPVVSLDGYYGIKIAEGVILVPMNLNVTASGGFANSVTGNETDIKKYNSSVSTNGKGLRNNVGTKSNPTLWCSILQDIGEPYRWVRIEGGSGTSTGSVSWGVYASSTAAAGTYTIPKLFIGQGLINDSGTVQYTASTLQGSSITVRRPLACQIVSPTSIDFGTVNITGKSADQLLATQSKDLEINCASDTVDAVADMTLAFSGQFPEGNYWGRLSVTNSDSQVMGYIRGRYINASGSCAPDTVNEVGFNGTSGTKTIKGVQNGITKVPMTWSLCSNGASLLGRGNAQATININWD